MYGWAKQTSNNVLSKMYPTKYQHDIHPKRGIRRLGWEDLPGFPANINCPVDPTVVFPK